MSVVRCRRCGLHYVDALVLDEQASKDHGVKAFEEGADYINEIYENKRGDWLRYYQGWLSRIEKLAPGRRLLDVGCGIGYLVYFAGQRGWDAYGLEISRDEIRYGNEKLGLAGRLMDGLLDPARFEDKFDVVTLFSVIEHVDDPFQFLLSVREVMTPDGILIIKTPSQASLVTKIHWALHRLSGANFDLDLYDREHIYRFSPQTLGSLLEKANFRVISWEPDDRLWITSTRYLFNKNHRLIRQAGISGLYLMGKITGMQNQFVTIAQRNPACEENL